KSVGLPLTLPDLLLSNQNLFLVTSSNFYHPEALPHTTQVLKYSRFKIPLFKNFSIKYLKIICKYSKVSLRLFLFGQIWFHTQFPAGSHKPAFVQVNTLFRLFPEN